MSREGRSMLRTLAAALAVAFVFVAIAQLTTTSRVEVLGETSRCDPVGFSQHIDEKHPAACDASRGSQMGASLMYVGGALVFASGFFALNARIREDDIFEEIDARD